MDPPSRPLPPPSSTPSSSSISASTRGTLSTWSTTSSHSPSSGSSPSFSNEDHTPPTSRPNSSFPRELDEDETTSPLRRKAVSGMQPAGAAPTSQGRQESSLLPQIRDGFVLPARLPISPGVLQRLAASAQSSPPQRKRKASSSVQANADYSGEQGIGIDEQTLQFPFETCVGEEERKRRRSHPPPPHNHQQQLEFAQLPSELQLHVFSFVPLTQVHTTLPLVCRTWRQLARDDGLWHTLFDLHFGGRKEAQRQKPSWREECLLLIHQLAAMEAESRSRVNKIVEDCKAKILEEEQRSWQQLFLWACQNGYIQMVDNFYAKHSSFLNLNVLFVSDQYQRTPLMAAVEGGHMEVVEFLISNHAKVNATTPAGWTALMIAASRGRLKVVEYLAAHGADVNAVNSGGCTALMFAVEKGHVEMVDFLLSQNAHVNVASAKGWTALIIAANKGHDKITEILLAHKADVRAATHEGLTALMAACFKGQESTVELLLTGDSDVDARANLGVTALMGAADKGYAKVVEMLIMHGADVNATTDDGWTALMGASDNGHAEIVQMLLNHNADARIERSNGDSALSLAKDRGHTQIAHLLKEHLRHKE